MKKKMPEHIENLGVPVVTQAAEDYMLYGSRLARLKAKILKGEKLSDKEALKYKVYEGQILNLEKFFISEYFKVFSDLDGALLLAGLKEELKRTWNDSTKHYKFMTA